MKLCLKRLFHKLVVVNINIYMKYKLNVSFDESVPEVFFRPAKSPVQLKKNKQPKLFASQGRWSQSEWERERETECVWERERERRTDEFQSSRKKKKIAFGSVVARSQPSSASAASAASATTEERVKIGKKIVEQKNVT